MKIQGNAVSWHEGCYLFGAGTRGTNQYVQQFSKYIRFSDELAFIQFNITISSIDPAMSGQVRIGRLPVSVFSVSGGSVGLSFQNIGNITLSPGYTQFALYAQQGDSYLGLVQIGSGLPCISVDSSQLSSGATISAAGIIPVV